MRSHLKYRMPVCSSNLEADVNHLEAFNIPLSCSLLRGAAANWPDNRIQNIHGPIRCGSKLVFPPPVRPGLKGHPYVVLQGKSHRRRVAKWWNSLCTPHLVYQGQWVIQPFNNLTGFQTTVKKISEVFCLAMSVCSIAAIADLFRLPDLHHFCSITRRPSTSLQLWTKTSKSHD